MEQTTTGNHGNGRENFSRPLESLVLLRVAQRHQQELADALDLSTTHVSRILAGEYGVRLPQLEAFLGYLGLEVQDAREDTVTVPREEYEALRTLARRALNGEE